MNRSPRDRTAVVCVASAAVLLGLSWIPLWAFEVPPLQDYPYHLAQVAVLVEGTGAGDPFAESFTGTLAFRPYAAFYAVARTFAAFVPLETAGRLALCVPGLLWGLLLATRWRRIGEPPWGALLWFPLSLALSYQLGFLSYVWSLPLLGLALEEQARLAEGAAGSARRLALWVVGLFLTHPFTFLAFLGLGALRVLCEAPLPGGRRRVVSALLLAAVAFALWFASVDAEQGATTAQGIVWPPWEKRFELILLLFTGHGGFASVVWPVALLWLALGVGVVHAIAVARDRTPDLRFWACTLVVTLSLALLTPFRIGSYSYIDARLPEIAFLAMGMVASSVRFGVFARAGLVVGCVLLLALAVPQQRSVATSMAEVLPLLERIPRDAAVLPLVFDDDHPALEASIFDPHVHVHHYFHVRGGTGVTPYFFPHPLVPVQYRSGSPPPAPRQQRPAAYHPDRYPAWRHLLVRAAPPRFLRRLETRADEVARSGAWRLYRVRDGSALELEEAPAAHR